MKIRLLNCQWIWIALQSPTKEKPKAGDKSYACRSKRVSIVVSLMVLCFSASVYAQEILGIQPAGRSGEERPEILEEKPPAPPPRLLLPPPPPKRKGKELPLKSVFARKIIVTGSTVFSPGELAEVTAPYENRQLTNEDLEALRRALTLFYINKGYVNSGAIIPDQTVVDGVITIQIIEGELTHIEVEGNKWFRDAFIENRIALGAEAPLNIGSLQQRLQLMQQDARIKRIHAELTPGVKPGESVMKAEIEEKLPFRVSLGFNNYQSPTVGAERGLITLAHENLTGNGDILSFTYGRSEGLKPEIDVWYSLPVTARDTTLLMRYRKNDFDVVEEPFEDLDIESDSDIYEVSLRHPFYRTLNQEFAMTLTGEHLHNETFLLGEPFSFSLGAEDGESTVSALRFSQEWTYRTQRQVLAARSRFSFGIDALGATINESEIPDGEFLSWLGQFQWARILGLWDIQVLFRTDMQLSDDPLLPLEQIAVGGRYSVRGYRENLLVRDKALISSLEFRVPLIRDTRWADYLQLVPFADYGTAWNQDLPTPSPKSIWSVGLGLRWAATLMKSPFELRPQLEFYWGYALKDVDIPEDHDLQDDGIHFQFVVTGL